MLAYIILRILLMIPTLFGIMVLTFVIVQFAPGGPIEQVIAQIQGTAQDATARFSGGGGGDFQDMVDPSRGDPTGIRSEEHTSELQSLMRISYAVFCLTKKNRTIHESQICYTRQTLRQHN